MALPFPRQPSPTFQPAALLCNALWAGWNVTYSYMLCAIAMAMIIAIDKIYIIMQYYIKERKK
jgi:hypothetical protein